MGRAIRLLACMLSSLLALAGCAQNAAPAPEAEAERGLSSLVIVLDPGHGGIDHGAVSADGLLEDRLNLQISQMVKELLLQAGAVVVMTRDGDGVDYSGEATTRKRRDMNNRAALIQENHPQAIISIHMNKYPSSTYHGSLTFYWNKNEGGKRLASCIQDALIDGLPGNNSHPARPGNYFILHACDAPSALVECGFLSNPGDEKMLQDPEYQWRIAECIYQGICAYFEAQEDVDRPG